MNTLAIRRAEERDYPEIGNLCRALDPNDYVLKAWPIWMSTANAINLVAQDRNRIVGCAYGEILAYPDAWSQGVRVSLEMRRMGVGLKLMAALEQTLISMGATAIFGNIGAFNKTSLAFFTAQNWKIAVTIKRRSAAPRKGTRRERRRFARKKLIEVVRSIPALASIERMAYFKRAYFSMNDAYIERAISNQSVRISPDGDAFAILDPNETDSRKRMWVVALAGSHRGMQRLLEELLDDAGICGAELMIDSTDDRDLQVLMDELQFGPPEKDGSYHVVRKRLTRQTDCWSNATKIP